MEGMTIFFQFWEGSLFSPWWKPAYVRVHFGTEGVKGHIVFPAASQICASATGVCSPSGNGISEACLGSAGCLSTTSALPAMVVTDEL